MKKKEVLNGEESLVCREKDILSRFRLIKVRKSMASHVLLIHNFGHKFFNVNENRLNLEKEYIKDEVIYNSDIYYDEDVNESFLKTFYIKPIE